MEATCKLLLDTPASAFQALLKHVTHEDITKLRQVSSNVSIRTTQHLPHLHLRLSKYSTQEYLDAWCQATQRLAHVSTIHIHIIGRIAPELWDSVMQLLSQRGSVKELHLLGVKSSCRPNCLDDTEASCTACLPTLHSISHLQPTLKILVIKDVAVERLAADMQKLVQETAGEWQLQSLTLHVTESDKAASDVMQFSAILLSVAQLFPRLQKVDLAVPELRFKPPHVRDEADPAVLPSQHQMRHQLPAIATTAALAGAVRQLRHLQVLRVTGLPDAWKAAVIPDADATAVIVETLSSAAATVDPETGSTFRRVPLQSLPFPAAAEALETMDSLSWWLLQQQTQLSHLLLGCGNWTMSWQNCQQQQQVPEGSAHGATSELQDTALPLVDIRAHYYTYKLLDTAAAQSYDTVLEDFLHRLSYYSNRSTPDLCCLISSLHITLVGHQLGDESLAELLRMLPSLKELKIKLLLRSADDHNFSARLARTMSAVALPGLESFSFTFSAASAKPVLTNITEALLPLTAAAGGPGSTLQELHLTANFAATAAKDGKDQGWHLLKQLVALRKLSIHHIGSQLLQFPASSLPPELETFRAQKLDMQLRSSSASVAGVASSFLRLLRFAKPVTVNTGQVEGSSSSAEQYPELRVLDMRECRLCEPSKLSSKQIKELTVDTSSWPGGWKAAATAWPAVQNLTFWFGNHFLDGWYSRKLRPQVAAALDEWSVGLCEGLPNLKSLTVQHVPDLSEDTLQFIGDRLKQLQHVFVAVPRKTAGDDSASGDGIGSEQQGEMQTWLQQQLPWATVLLQEYTMNDAQTSDAGLALGADAARAL